MSPFDLGRGEHEVGSTAIAAVSYVIETMLFMQVPDVYHRYPNFGTVLMLWSRHPNVAGYHPDHF